MKKVLNKEKPKELVLSDKQARHLLETLEGIKSQFTTIGEKKFAREIKKQIK